MIIYGLMKYIEKIPLRYDKVMNVLTLGNHQRSRDMLLAEVKEGMELLDIGCGTGAFAIEAAAKGARVTAVDASPEMLKVFRGKLSERPELIDCVEIHECGAASIETVLGERHFDLITASLMLGELPDPVRTRTIKGASNLLKPDGVFLVCDEFWPTNPLKSLAYHFLFWIFFIPNFILTRTLIQPVKGFQADLEVAKLTVKKQVNLLGGAISLVWTQRSECSS